jgi:hypothetical protein
MDQRTRSLIDINIHDILEALGVPACALARRLARGPALRFAREMTSFDSDVDRRGIAAASRSLLDSFSRGVRTRGLHQVPARGPVLLLSNHPGMTDTLVLLSAIPRGDLLVLAAERPFLRALPAASRWLIFIPEKKEQRLAAMRRAVAHLRSGGALLTFPAGEIEPDPAVLPGAEEALSRWSQSSMAFLRFVPDCAVVPLIVSGVLEPRAQKSPLVWILQRRKEDRERLAAMLQVLVHTLFPGKWRTRVTLEVCSALAGRELLARRDGASALLTGEIALRLRERA